MKSATQLMLYLGQWKYAGVALIQHAHGLRYVQKAGQMTEQDTPVMILNQHTKTVKL